MKMDLSRSSYQAEHRFRSVRQQQGRVLTDADWNEQRDIEGHHQHTAQADLLGVDGAPRDAAGFSIAPATNSATGDATLSIGAGRYYLKGRLFETYAEQLFEQQSDQPGASLPGDDGYYLAYLAGRARAVTALEEPRLRDIALTGVDVSARIQHTAQVQLLPIAAPASADLHPGFRAPEWDTFLSEQPGRLQARTIADGVPQSPCAPAARGGYTGTDNRLYRIEIHQGGAPGTATFKWSRDNATLATEWLGQPDSVTLQIRSAGRDRAGSFAPGDWIEIDDEGRELRGEPGTFARVTRANDNQLTIDPDTLRHGDGVGGPNAAGGRALDINEFGDSVGGGVRRIRRWDNTPGALPETPVPAGTETTWLDIESGIQISLDFDAAAGRVYKTGDAWLIPARAVSRNIEWPCESGTTTPRNLAPANRPLFAPLAIVERQSDVWNVRADLRRLFAPIREATLSVSGGDGQALHPDAELPEALRVRVARGGQPQPGVRVRFSLNGAGGSLVAVGDAANTGTSIDLISDEHGLASVLWTTGSDRSAQTANAVLIQTDDPDADDFNQPREASRVYFRAHTTLATATEHSPAAMPDPDGADLMAGVDTVAQALDRLGETKVNRAGDVITGDLEIQGNFTVRGDVIARDTDHMPGDVLLGDQDEDTITIHGTLTSEHTSDALVINDSVQVNISGANETPLEINATLQGFQGRLYRAPITLDNTANASTLTDFQVLLSIDTAALITAGKLRANGGDLLFTDSDGETTVAHWIESDIDTATTRVWVRVPQIAGAATRTVYMYYGNPAADQTTNPNTVFERTISGLLTAYNFDEGSGAVLGDATGGGVVGTLVNTGSSGDPTWSTGQFDGSLAFNGDQQYVSMPAFASPTQLNDFTASVWVKMNAGLPDGGYFFFDLRGDGPTSPGGSFGMSVAYSGGQATLNHFMAYPTLPNSTIVNSPIADPAGTWTHFVFLRRGSSVESYVNGTRIPESFGTGNPLVPPRSDALDIAQPWRIGARFDQGFLQGELDDLRLYNRALDADEIADIFGNHSYVSTATPTSDLLRSFAANEPTVAPGAEETLSASQGSVFYIQSGSGNVGVGTANPAEKLSVAGIIETTSGGIKFPDGTIQTTAGGGGSGLISGGANLPIGTIIAWHRDLDGSIPALPDGWAECDGSTVSDPDSPLFGRQLPTLNTPFNGHNSKGSFLRGGTTSGEFEIDTFQGHMHGVYPHAGTHDSPEFPPNTTGANGGDAQTTVRNSTSSRPRDDGAHGTPRFGPETRPVNMSVVWIIRIKDSGDTSGLWSTTSGGVNLSDGNVGIDQSAPTDKLHIGGTPGQDGIRFPDGTLQTTASGGSHLPLGTIIVWHKSATGTPLLPDGWAECNGQTLNDPASPYNNTAMPDLNNPQNTWNAKGSFLRGHTSSGEFEADQFQGHSHSFTTTLYGFEAIAGLDIPKNSANGRYTHPEINGTTDDGSNGTPRIGPETRPVNMTVVWIMKVRDTSPVAPNLGGYAIIEDRQPDETLSGQVTPQVWNTRTLNTLNTNIPGVNLNNNELTLPAGTYLVRGRAPAHRVGRHSLRLRNITDSTDALIGPNAATALSDDANDAQINGVLTLESPKALQLQHWTSNTTGPNDHGLASSTGLAEIYATMEIIQLAQPAPEGADLVGSVQSFATETAPPGWLACDGREVSRLTYARLFQRIGDRFGTGDGSTTFTLPDMRGEFVRGWDDGRGVDTGRTIGTAQDDQMQGHFHQGRLDQFNIGAGVPGIGGRYADGGDELPTYTTGAPLTDGTNGTPRTGSETRPRNIALLYCIRF